MKQYSNIFSNNNNIDVSRQAYQNKDNYFKKINRFDENIFLNKKETQAERSISFDSMNTQINKEKNNINLIMSKDKEIQQLKNDMVLLNREVKDMEKYKNEVTKLESDVKYFKNKLDEQYNINNKTSELKNNIELLEKNNNELKKELDTYKNKDKILNLKKVLMKHTDSTLDRINNILLEEKIDDDFFIKKDITNEIMKIIIDKINSID